MVTKLSCEVCDGKLIGKPNGIFECEFCGVEYSLEWAKAKMHALRGSVKIDEPIEIQDAMRMHGNASVAGLIKRGMLALEDKQWKKASDLFDEALNIEPECAEAYLGLAMADYQCPDKNALIVAFTGHNGDNNIRRAKQFANKDLTDFFLQAELEREKKIAYLAERRKIIAQAKNLVPLDSDTIFYGQGYLTAYAEGKEYRTYLKNDGTVLVDIYESDDDDGMDYVWKRCKRHEVFSWQQIVDIAVGDNCIFGLRKNGTVQTYKGRMSDLNCYKNIDISSWKNIVAISSSHTHVVGLCDDKTVVAAGGNKDGQCNVSKWTNIVAVGTGGYYNPHRSYDFSGFTIGLKADGCVVATGNNSHNQCNVHTWTDVVAISVYGDNVIGLRADGTVLATGGNSHGQCNVEQWTDIVAIAATDDSTYGIHSDGTVIIAGVKSNTEVRRRFYSIDTISQDREEFRQKVLIGQKIKELTDRKKKLQTELNNLSLFSVNKRKEIEYQISTLHREIANLQGS